MADGHVLAVRTPHQAERAGLAAASDGVAPVTLDLVARKLAIGDDTSIHVASRSEVWLATRHAAEQAGVVPLEGASPERRAAIVAAWNAAVGWVLRTGAAEIPGGDPSPGRVARHAVATLAGAGRIDPRGVAWRAREHGPGRDEIAGRRVIVRGIVPTDVETLAAIEALHAASGPGAGVRLVLPRPLGDGPGDAPGASTLGGPGEGAGPQRHDADDAALATHLERRWSVLDDPPDIEWLPPREVPLPIDRIEAPTAAAEAREVAAEIAQALERGVAPEDVVVVVARADDPIASLVSAELADAGIPSSREGGEPLDRSPEVAVALDLLSMAGGRITRDGLADLLRAPGLHAGTWVGAAHEDDAARAALSIAHRLRSIPVAVDRDGGARLVEALDAVDPRAAAAVGQICRQLGELGAVRGRAAIARALRDLAHRVRLGRPSASELGAALRAEAKDRRGGLAAARLRAIGEGSRGVSRVVDTALALGDAEAKLGLPAAPTECAELAAEVRELLRGATAGPPGGAPRAGAVRIATARDVVGLPHALVILTGMGASAHGATEVRGLVDEERLARLAEPHRPPPIAARRAGRTMELQWLARDAERVLLTRRAGGGGGHDEAPHRLFADVHALAPRAFGGDVRRAPASSLQPRARAVSARDHVRASLAAGSEARLTGRLRLTVAAAREAHEERTRFFLEPRTAPGRFSGALDPARDPLLPARFGGDAPERSIAVTHVERAARCAFAGFASRVLRARRVEDALEDANPRERGTLVHGALHAAYEAMRAAQPSEGEVDRRRRAEAAALAHTRADRATPLRREALLAAVRDAMAIVDLDLASGDAAFYALGEQRFGPGEAAPWGPLPLHAGDAHDASPVIWVEGQIDRIDRAGDARWARIVDYKTGKLPRKKDEHHRALQLSIYADAVARWLEATSDVPFDVGGRYIEGKRGSARVRDVEVSREAREITRDAARRVVLGLWSGDVDARAADPRMCRRCEARDICRKPAVAAEDDAPDADKDEGGRA